MRKHILRVCLSWLALVGTLFFIAERALPRAGVSSGGLFWLAEKGSWAPDYGQCATCGEFLIPQVDEFSACGDCPRCKVRYRHKSFPRTLEDQERLWK